MKPGDLVQMRPEVHRTNINRLSLFPELRLNQPMLVAEVWGESFKVLLPSGLLKSELRSHWEVVSSCEEAA